MENSPPVLLKIKTNIFKVDDIYDIRLFSLVREASQIHDIVEALNIKMLFLSTRKKNQMEVKEVPLLRGALTKDDVFILDLGNQIYQVKGTEY